jgi:hypothetical protein
VSFIAIPPGLPVADGTVLDGVDTGYILLQPEILKFAFNKISGFPDEDLTDVVSIAFKDNYNGPFGAYAAAPANAIWDGLIFDNAENLISGCDVVQECFFDIGLNQNYISANPFLTSTLPLDFEDQFNVLLCPNNFNFQGWVKIEVTGLDDLENEIGIVANIGDIGSFNSVGSAVYMHAE